jgi:hypothetical protein
VWHTDDLLTLHPSLPIRTPKLSPPNFYHTDDRKDRAIRYDFAGTREIITRRLWSSWRGVTVVAGMNIERVDITTTRNALVAVWCRS